MLFCNRNTCELVKNMPAHIISSLSGYDSWHERIEGTNLSPNTKPTNNSSSPRVPTPTFFQVHLKFQLSDFRKGTNDSWSYCSHVFLYALSLARVLLCALSVPRGMSYRGLNMVFSTWRHAITILWKWKSTSNYELHKRSVGRNCSRNLKRGAIRMTRERGKREGREGYGLLFFILKPSVERGKREGREGYGLLFFNFKTICWKLVIT